MEDIRGPEPVEVVRRLVQSARTSGLRGIISTLHSALTCDVGLFDLKGSAISAVPTRTIWDYSVVLKASLESRGEHAITATRIYADNEAVAILAANTTADPDRYVATAVDLITLEIGRLRARQEGKRELATHVVEDLINGRIAETEGLTRLLNVGFDPRSRYRLLLGSADTRRERLVSVPWNIHTLLTNQDEPFLRVVANGHVLMLVPDDPMTEQVAAILLDHMSVAGSNASVGVSSGHAGVAGLRAAYFEALAAVHQGPGVQAALDVDIAQLLLLTNSALPLRDLAVRTLGPLLDYDAEHKSNLLGTLRAYLVADRLISQASDDMFIHRNTLRYRIRLIEELLGRNIDSTRNSTNLWLALQALDTSETGTSSSPS